MSIGRMGGRAALVCVGVLVAMAFGAVSASAESVSFTTEGCSNWEVPAGVSQLTVAATGGAGEKGGDIKEGNLVGEGGAGGNGDEVGATVGVSPHEVLDVCVSHGAGSGGAEGALRPGEFGNFGGNGGGASGLARSADFSAPVLVAGGGGGGGGAEAGKGYVHNGGGGGSAGMAGGACAFCGGLGGGAVEGGSASNGGGPGVGANGENGERHFSSSEGGGGGGGGGYVGGGGGERLAGGAGGTDFCAGTGVSACATVAEAGTGAGSVMVSYTVATCKTAVGLAKYEGVGGRLQVRNKLNTNTSEPEVLRTSAEGGAVRFRLTKLYTATCVGLAGERVFSGEGKAAMGTSGGWAISFSIGEKAGGFYYQATLVKGSTVIVEGGPLGKVSFKQNPVEKIE